MEYLSIKDITDNLVVIKINRSYHANMSSEELYDYTRGIWRRKIESVIVADYALSVVFGTVVEVYKIDRWMPATQTTFKTRTCNPARAANRIAFIGRIAEDSIRSKYVGKSVAHLYEFGEANPVKLFLKNER